MKTLLRSLTLSLALVGFCPANQAQSTPPEYGAPISLAQARKVAEAALDEAARNDWAVVVAVVDPGGHLVLLSRADGAQFGSIEVARAKAYTSAAFRRTTKVFEEGVAAGGAGLRLVALPGGIPNAGGVPLIVDGKVIGAVGISGATSAQDHQVAEVAAAALK